ncbi:hypothetical protein MUGA111182_06695 [Mucilaginibacter galii]|uniref:DUF4369 domain-containing protein n=1 Tax=Mucilaginibacter galii TaxID=2005073 RepID=A0A917JDD8_9SPHI|nr:hypothetical protein [Mucilaginibacter galii]GGI51659.1 hypothetical protein GCM10011425_28710 [Mucilaginibacter galii]
MKSFILVIVLFILTSTGFSQDKPVRTGVHSFTIQWIGYNNGKPGTVTIKAIGNGVYSIEGEQRNKKSNEYVTIKGTFKPVGRELLFNGKIVSKVELTNNGQPCTLDGAAVFKASGARKYWRLQQMVNCDGETTDYIDIFF